MKKSFLTSIVLLGYFFSASMLYAGDGQREGWGQWLKRQAGFGLSIPVSFVSTLFFQGAHGEQPTLLSSLKSGAKPGSHSQAASNFMKRQDVPCDSCCPSEVPCDSCCPSTPTCDTCPIAPPCDSCCGPNCCPSLNFCEHNLNYCNSRLGACSSDLHSCNTQLNIARTTIAAVKSVCSDVSTCNAQLTNFTEIQTALDQLTNSTVPDSVVSAVQTYIRQSLGAGSCASANGVCNGGQGPTVTPCGTSSVSSAASSLSPSQIALASTVVATIVLNYDVVEDVAAGTMEAIRCGYRSLVGVFSQPGYSLESVVEPKNEVSARE